MLKRKEDTGQTSTPKVGREVNIGSPGLKEQRKKGKPQRKQQGRGNFKLCLANFWKFSAASLRFKNSRGPQP